MSKIEIKQAHVRDFGHALLFVVHLQNHYAFLSHSIYDLS